MALNLKNAEVEKLATQVAELAGETKTEAVRRALAERKERLLGRRAQLSKRERLLELLEKRIWPSAPRGVLGVPLSKREREEILGYGPEGV